jgi:hypothetical protein
VGVTKALLRAYSYIFEGLLALFVIAICGVALATHSPLNLAFLPWTGVALTYWLLSLAVAGLVTLLLALGGKVRVLFFLWSLAVFVLLFKGLFVSFYSFAGPVSFKTAAWLTLGSLVGALGAFPWARRPVPVRRPQKW